ncbi:hypothetical protein CONLIGDRAFT_41824 [Coniochaeta ligniaria NRRL 30616]|uniref:Uncharacterized protein n=1 Tax=Coniochaeta ligniaria NRRL 30616 TaxID=1408157 RepID=A0A1J7J6W2_9PEZI|nr:hypothetical protein CONLIGDRAFT_41824 [Coniochaeta ligniaria NRRL 30616]
MFHSGRRCTACVQGGVVVDHTLQAAMQRNGGRSAAVSRMCRIFVAAGVLTIYTHWRRTADSYAGLAPRHACAMELGWTGGSEPRRVRVEIGLSVCSTGRTGVASSVLSCDIIRVLLSVLYQGSEFLSCPRRSLGIAHELLKGNNLYSPTSSKSQMTTISVLWRFLGECLNELEELI